MTKPQDIPPSRWESLFGADTRCEKCRGSGKVLRPMLFGLIAAKVPCSCTEARASPAAPARHEIIRDGVAASAVKVLADVETDLKGTAG